MKLPEAVVPRQNVSDAHVTPDTLSVCRDLSVGVCVANVFPELVDTRYVGLSVLSLTKPARQRVTRQDKYVPLEFLYVFDVNVMPLVE